MSRAAAFVAALPLSLPTAAQRDDDIRNMVIQDSIARFNGLCPCPYSYDRGEQCAGKSAYSRRLDPSLSTLLRAARLLL